MKTLKITLLLAIIGLSINASAQTITVSFDDNTSYSGFYEVKLYVIDTYTQDVCLVAQIKNIAEPGVPFYSNQIDLTCVNLVSDQIDRYRYIANVADKLPQEAVKIGHPYWILAKCGGLI